MNTYTAYTLTTATQDFFQRYVDFSGRSTRSAFWYFVLAYLMISFALAIIEVFADLTMLSSLWSLATFIPWIALSCRRLHDMGKSAWNLLWVILPSIACVGLLIAIVASVFTSLAQLPRIADEELINQFVQHLDGSLLAALVLCSLVYLFGCILILVYSIFDSQRGTNKWGPSEKYPDAE